MADTKLSALTADATPTTDDLIYVVNDPGGTPASRKVTIANLQGMLTITESQISDLGTYLTGNETITISGDVSGSGTTAITATIAAGAVDLSMLSATGTKDSTTFLRGDNTFAVPASASAASTTAAGVVELATSAETITGTDTARAVTPAGLQAKIDNDEVTGTSGQIYVFNGSNALAAVTMSGDGTISNAGALDISSVSDILIQDYGLKKVAASSSAGTLTLDYSAGPVFSTTLSENVTTLTLSNWPASGTEGTIRWYMTQDTTARTVAFGSVIWAGGTAPTISTGSGAVDCYCFTSNDGGTTVFGHIVGQDYS